MTARIRRARPDEAGALSRLAQASKAVWDYTPEQLATFREELTLADDEIELGHAHLLESAAGGVLGFYTLLARVDGALELEHLFVAPDALRAGHGRRLLVNAAELARELGFASLEIQSDPNATAFYLRCGAHLVREIPSSIEGRTIPLLELPVDAVCPDGVRD